MGVEVNGLDDVFDELEELQDDYGRDGEDWQVGTNVEYAIYLEFGSSSHVIQGNPLLYFENEEGQLISKEQVKHPGTDPQPFFRPAANEVRLQGPGGFIRHNTKRDPEEIGSTREFVATLAFALQRRMQEIITDKGLIDTGNLRASVRATPVGDVSNLPDASEVNPNEVFNPLDEYSFET
jgi:hypothetical protein